MFSRAPDPPFRGLGQRRVFVIEFEVFFHRMTLILRIVLVSRVRRFSGLSLKYLHVLGLPFRGQGQRRVFVIELREFYEWFC